MNFKNLDYLILDNGLKCILYRRNSIPIVNITIAFKVGSKDEEVNKKGIAHLFEHLMYEGSKNLAKGDYDKICSAIGGSNNAYTSFDITSYYITIPSSQLEVGLWLEAERLFNFEINKESLENQKNVVIEEINQTVYDQPYGLARDKIAELAYSSQCPYSWDVHGSIQTVASITLEDIYEFKNKYYIPTNAVMIISGHFKVNDVKNLIIKYFNKNFNDIAPKRNKVYKKDFKYSGQTFFKDEVPFEATFLAYHCEGFVKNYFNSSDLISVILGGGKSSRIYKNLIDNLNIASQAGCYIDKKAYDSLIIFYAFSNNRKINSGTLAERIYEQIENLVEKNPRDEEILKAKNIVKINLFDDLSNLIELSDILAVYTLFYNNPYKLFDYKSEIDNLTSDLILRDIKKIFRNKEGIRVDAKLSK